MKFGFLIQCTKMCEYTDVCTLCFALSVKMGILPDSFENIVQHILIKIMTTINTFYILFEFLQYSKTFIAICNVTASKDSDLSERSSYNYIRTVMVW